MSQAVQAREPDCTARSSSEARDAERRLQCEQPDGRSSETSNRRCFSESAESVTTPGMRTQPTFGVFHRTNAHADGSAQPGRGPLKPSIRQKDDERWLWELAPNQVANSISDT